jgi:flagellar motor switch protein FliM
MITREVTEIEDHIAKGLVRIICEEMQVAWRPFNVEVKMGARQVPLELQTQFTASERAFVFGFDVRLPDGGGGIQLMLPIASSAAFLRTATKDSPADKGAKKSAMSARLAEKLLESNFEIDLALEGCKVQANDLLNLSDEKILRLGLSVRTPVMLQIGGRDCFEAVPVRSGHSRAAQLMDRLQPKTSQGKEQ